MTGVLRALFLIGMSAIFLVPCRMGSCAGVTASRQCLNQAAAAAQSIELEGDQSAARRTIACALAHLDPNAVLDLAGRIRRPSDAARALGAASSALAKTDPGRAKQAANTASRLLSRIVEPVRREQEQRLLLGEIAVLGNDAVTAGSELPTEEARAIVATALARSDPSAALALLRSWKTSTDVLDQPLATIADALSQSDPDQAVKVAAEIHSERQRNEALWRLAQVRPPAEGVGIAQRVTDPLVRSAILTGVARRAAPDDPGLAESAARQVSVASESALAEVSVGLALTDTERALGAARGLSDPARKWALGRIAVRLAGSKPEIAEGLLREAGASSELIRLVVTRMAEANAGMAEQTARSLPAGESRDTAVAAVAGVVAASDPRRASDLLWEINDPAVRTRELERVAVQTASTDADAATSLIGLMPDAESGLRLRAKVAARIAPKDPTGALRLLATLPESDYRVEAALEAASAILLAGGNVEGALKIADLGVQRDVALRWLLPTLATVQASSPINLSDSIGDAYLRAVALTDVAKRLERTEPKAKVSPARAQMIRPVAEWEGL